MITELLHKTLGKEAEQVVEDISSAVIPQVQAAAEKTVTDLLPRIQESLVGAIIPALEKSAAGLIDGRRVVISIEVQAK